MTLQPVFRQILAHARNAAGRTAIACDGRHLPYGELALAVQRRADFLANEHQVSPGERVVLLADSNDDFISAYLAIHSLGAICAPLDPHIARDRLVRIVQRLSPRIVISPASLPPDIGAQVLFSECRAAVASPSAGVAEVSMEQPADILFTTGTTADPKGVVLSHGALATATAHINRFIGTGADAVEVLPLLMSHSFGLGRMRCVLSLGGTLVPVSGFLNAATVTRALSTYRATGLASVPAGIAVLLSDGGTGLAQFADQLEYLELGSSAMPKEQKRALMALLPNTRLCMHYGLTEASRSAYISFHDDDTKLDSIGRPSPGVEMRVVGASGIPIGDGVAGQIEVRGGHVMSGYWRDPGLTGSTLRDGWLRTGDIGWKDDEGFFYLEARADDVINVGGRKILPREIEEILAGHPAIAECACVGIPDPQGLSGEIISAWLVPKHANATRPGSAELAKLLRQKLEPYKTPRTFQWTDRIPRSSTGKVLRRRLRELK